MNERPNIFEQFHGADIERLVECLQAIRAARLSIDQYTQAGINQSSGNVWVWSEDWPGCVYCSIGFDVAWSYSCSYCGEEYDFDTYFELEEFADRMNDHHDGRCDACREDSEEPNEQEAA